MFPPCHAAPTLPNTTPGIVGLSISRILYHQMAIWHRYTFGYYMEYGRLPAQMQSPNRKTDRVAGIWLRVWMMVRPPPQILELISDSNFFIAERISSNDG